MESKDSEKVFSHEEDAKIPPQSVGPHSVLGESGVWEASLRGSGGKHQ